MALQPALPTTLGARLPVYVRNTFLWVPEEDAEDGSPMRPAKSEPVGFRCGLHPMVPAAALWGASSAPVRRVGGEARLRALGAPRGRPEEDTEPGAPKAVPWACEGACGLAAQPAAEYEAQPVKEADGHSEGEDEARALRPQGLAPLASRMLQSGGGPSHVYWTVDAHVVNSRDTKVASPQFLIALPGQKPCPFQLVIYAEARGPRWGSSGFQRARGRGRVELRRCAELPEGHGRITFGIEVGSGRRMQPQRPAVSHDFSLQSCCGLRRWDFAAAVDPATRSFVIHLEIAHPAPEQGSAFDCGAPCGAGGPGWAGARPPSTTFH